jgi:myo-inositol-1(or 4)-monophosphatase
MADRDDFARVGREAALEAGQLLLRRFQTEFAVSKKGIVNLVTEVDIAAEKLIVSRIRKAFPTHLILAEENHSQVSGSGFKWIIDPLDGTTNYAHGYPVFSVSIGLEVAGELEWGAVFDPTRNELFTASRGAGAFCNDAPVRVSKTESLVASLLATGFPYDVHTSRQNNLKNYCAFAVRSQGVRRGGSAAVDLCYVAAGRLDGFWELKLNPWDCAAGTLIVREAGGSVTDFRDRPSSIYGGEIVASNALIHGQMLETLEAASEDQEA